MTSATHLAIVGDLTINRIADALKSVRATPKTKPLLIDLSATQEADSSAVAFLLNCLRLGRERGIDVTFKSIPEQVVTLADIYGLKSVILGATVKF